MKGAITFLIAISYCVITLGQIPNAGFEVWELHEQLEKPAFWITNQDSNRFLIIKDSVHVDGEYSMRIESNAGPFLCTTWAVTEFSYSPQSDENCSLNFYARTLSLNQWGSVSFSVACRVFSQGQFVTNYRWTAQEEIPEFQEISLPLGPCTFDSLKIIVNGGATTHPADGCSAESVCWIDALSLITTPLTSIEDIERTRIRIYPNPSTGTINIQNYSSDLHRYELFTTHGKLIQEGELNSSSMTLEQKGMFLLAIYSDRERFVQKLVVN